MGLRFKIILPTLIGFLVFALFLHNWWEPRHEDKLRQDFEASQLALLKTIEPEIVRTLLTQDYATLTNYLDSQLDIHNNYWRRLSLKLENGPQVYPLFEPEVPDLKAYIQLNKTVYEDNKALAEITLFLDWQKNAREIFEDTHEITEFVLFTLAVIIVFSTLWQSSIIIGPLRSLKKAVKALRAGDYDAELDLHKRDEIGELIRDFDKMRQQRQQAEESLRIAATAFDIHEGIIITDVDGNIIRVNKAFTRIMGYDEEAVTGKNPRIFKSGIHDEGFYQHLWHELINNGQWQGEIYNRHKNGEIIPMWYSISAVLDSSGNASHYVGSFLDISENKRYQQELEIARDKAEAASQAKSEFLAVMSHEIRTPMNGVLGMSQLLSNTELTPEQRNYLQAINTSGKNLLTIINDILDFSKIEAKKMQLELIQFDLQKACYEVIQTLNSKAEEKALELIFHIDNQCPRFVIGDPGRLRQILINLLGNAIKFTDEGHVLLEIRCQNTDSQHTTINFSVEDTGIGISPEQQSKLFDAFTQADSSTTRKFGGTGLGLTICRQLIELMQGNLGVDSVPGEGARFSFSLTLPVTESPIPMQLQSLTNLHVLIVDDNETNLSILQEQTREAGMKVSAVSSPGAAITLLEQAKQTDTRIDVAILDFLMPEQNGATLGQQILAIPEYRNLPLVLLTSAGQRGDARRFADIGFAGYLNKPATTETLLKMLAIVTDKKQREKHQDILTAHSITEIPSDQIAAKPTQRQYQNVRILLAEDDPINQQIVIGIFDTLGISPDIANNGKEVLQQVKSTHYDLILMDCQMPEMDGYEATVQLRQQEATRDIPVVALTANAQESDRERCLQYGMSDFLAKPFEFEDLIEIIDRWIPGY